MVSDASLRKKGPKLFDGQSSNGLGDDMISSLPDSIIHHILSFLPTTQVGRTCILSTRWRYLWRSTPSLYFSDDGLEITFENYKAKHKDFVDFVDRVFSLHDNTSNINKFRLEYKEPSGPSPFGPRIKTWMSMLARQRLVELILDINYGEFVLQHCDWLEIQNVNINAPSLTKLTLADSKSRTDFSETEIKVDARSLTSLSIPRTMLYGYSLGDLTSLVNASLKVDRGPFDVARGSQCLWKCVTSIYNVKDFELDILTIEALSSAGILTQMQPFPNLISMKVTNAGDGFNGPHLIKLLSCMPNVESLFIDVDDGGYSEYDDETQSGWPHEMVPLGFLSKLKSVEIRHLNGSEKELCLITYLLPRTLEKMTINLSFNLEARPKVQIAFLKSLLMLPRGSPGTSVEVW